MSQDRHTRRALIIFCLSAALLQAGVRPAAACSPIPPDTWFTERFSVENESLPPGISIQSGVQSDNIMTGDRGYLEIANSSAAPLYLLAQGRAANSAIEPLPVPLPAGMTPAYELRSGQSLALDVADLASLAPGLVEHNQQADDRPADVELPAPQDSQLTLVSADRLFTVSITLSYILNANYDPKQSQRSAAGCAVATYLAFGLPATAGLCLALLLLSAAGLLLRALWRRRNP